MGPSEDQNFGSKFHKPISIALPRETFLCGYMTPKLDIIVLLFLFIVNVILLLTIIKIIFLIVFYLPNIFVIIRTSSPEVELVTMESVPLTFEVNIYKI